MQIDAAAGRQIEDGPGQKASVGHDGDRVGRKSAQGIQHALLAEGRGLIDRQAALHGQNLDLAGLKLHAPAAGTVRLREDGRDLETAVEELLQGDGGEGRGPHENDPIPHR